MEDMKNAMKQIEMPDEMKERIRKNCLNALSHETEERPVKKRKPMKRTLLIAAALVLCLPVIGMAVSNSGAFKDVKNMFGTVTGTEYENATDGITVSLSTEENGLLVETAFEDPDIPPYRECEMLAIGTYQILEKTGTVVFKGTESPAVVIEEGQAAFHLPLEDLESGSYILMIDSFIGSKKADQPLPIYGNWEVEFAL